MDWAGAVNDWAEARAAEPNGPEDADAIAQDPFEALARFYFGSEPLGALGYARQLSVLRSEDGKAVGLQFVMNDPLQDPTLELQCSADLSTWTDLSPSACETLREEIGDQRLRVSIKAKPGALPVDARFLRVAIREKQ